MTLSGNDVGHWHPTCPPPDYGPPPGYGPPARVSDPVTGWVLVALGAIGVIGSLGPWATVHLYTLTVSLSGATRDGGVTVVLSTGVVALGVLIALRRAQLWAAIVATVASAAIALTALADVGNLSGLDDHLPAGTTVYGSISVGWGLWTVLAAGVEMLAASIVALVVRR